MKAFLSILIFLIISQLSYSQGGITEKNPFFRIGLKAGVNINKVEGQSYKNGFNYNYLLGIFGQFKVSRVIGIQPEINLTQGKAEFTNDGTSIYDDLFRGGSQKTAKFTNLQVPVLLNIGLGGEGRVKLQVGPQYNNILKQTTDSLKSSGDIFKNAEWSAVGGLWIQIPVVNIGARYVLGLTDINAIDNRQSWKNQGFNIFVGITF